MSNMSYCRFQNTDSDLADCQEALEEMLAGGSSSGYGKLSVEELRAAKRLVERCGEIVQCVAESMGLDLFGTDDGEKFEKGSDKAIDEMNKELADD